MTENYDDIIHLPHAVSKKRPQMPVSARAAQFAPFAALTGYEDAVRETARRTQERIELDENTKQLLDEKIAYIQAYLHEEPTVEFVYFREDEKKAGGCYVSVRGCVKKIDVYERTIVLQDGKKLPIADITEIHFD